MNSGAGSGRWGRKAVRIALGTAGGALLFLGAVGGFDTLVESTNSLEFCISCHDMRRNYEEYRKTVHYSNRSGVRAVCSDCHVPKRSWLAEMQRKLAAAHDVWGEIVGAIDTPQKYDAERLAMARREWARMKESDSIGCRNCHSFDSMSFDQQDRSARSKHSRAAMAESGKTCIDCHKGIAHDLPKVPDAETKED
jgi:cytochrome c-type protein NapC